MTILKPIAQSRTIRVKLKSNWIGGEPATKEFTVLVPDRKCDPDEMRMLGKCIDSIREVRAAVWDEGYVVDRETLTDEQCEMLKSVGLTWNKNNG